MSRGPDSADDADGPMDLAGMVALNNAALRRRLLARVHRSAESHREYVTLRREQGESVEVAAGARCRTLHAGPATRAEHWHLDAGVVLPWPQAAVGQELLVLDGALDDGEQTLGRHDYLLHEAGSRRMLRAGALGAEVYLRQRLAEGAALEARWWALAKGQARCSVANGRRWFASGAGVRVHRLWGDAEVVSMLVCFEAGASVPDHGHALDEDCLVLEGEMFLGDILLRAGDYQLAPTGGGHWGEMSDVGCTFFFHGALDARLTEAR
jgi:quercetin dioxygenase-like cupin family protein